MRFPRMPTRHKRALRFGGVLAPAPYPHPRGHSKLLWVSLEGPSFLSLHVELKPKLHTEC